MPTMRRSSLVEFRAMLGIVDPLPDQLPDQQQIGQRRQRGQQNLEQPDLRQRHHAQLAIIRGLKVMPRYFHRHCSVP